MTILLADDHPLYYETVKIMLENLNNTRVLTTSNYLGVINNLQSEQSITLLILDLKMPGMHGFSSVQRIYNHNPSIPILIASASDSPLTILSCKNAGASGFVSKASDISTLQEAVCQLLKGHSFFPCSIKDTEKPCLSNKQIDILYLLVEGYSNKEIAQRTFLSTGTVKQYVSDILLKLNVNNRVRAATQAREVLGLGN